MNVDELRGLTVYVYRNPLGDFTLGGVSARHDELTIVGIIDVTQNPTKINPMPKGSRVFDATPERPAVLLVKRHIDREVWSIKPLHAHLAGKWTMMGGNYAATSDSRFGDITGFYGAVAVHDRIES